MSEKEKKGSTAIKGFSPGDADPPKGSHTPRNSSSTLALVTIAVLAILILALSYLFLTWQPETVTQPPVVTVQRKPVPVKLEPVVAPKPQQPAKVQPRQEEPPAAPVPEAKLPKEKLAPVVPEKIVAVKTEPPVKKPTEVDKAATIAAVPVAPAASAEPSGKGYRLQVGAFVFKTNLDQRMEKLRALGYETRVQEKSADIEVTRLKVGLYKASEAAAQLSRISKIAPEAFSLKDADSIAIYAGSFKNAKRAQSYSKTLSTLDVATELVKVKVPMPLFKLHAGSYASKADADKALLQLKAKGIDAFVVGPF